MRNVGVTRKVDELGRIVIPKEIRRSFRIQEGETLEIFSTEDSIILKKFSRIKNIEDFASQYCKSMNTYIEGSVLITNCDIILAGNGPLTDLTVGNYVSDELRQIIIEGSFYESKGKSSINVTDAVEIESNLVIAPITSKNEPVGAVILVTDNTNIDESTEKASRIAADFISRYIDK